MNKQTTVAWVGETAISLTDQEFHISNIDARDTANVAAELFVFEPACFAEFEECLQQARTTAAPILFMVESREQLEQMLEHMLPKDDVCLSSARARELLNRLRLLRHRKGLAVDALTGLSQRQVLREQLEMAVNTASVADPVTLFLINVDSFKWINDSYGHASGDTILCNIAAILNSIISSNEVLARIGGDVFAILTRLPREHIGIYSKAISDAITQASFQIDESITVSIGVATTDSGKLTAEMLIKNADAACYEAKARGRAQSVIFDDMLDNAPDAGRDIALKQLENFTRIMSERVASKINQQSRKLVNALQQEIDLDGLTRLYNRRYFDRRLVREFAVALRQNRPLTVALVDIDHFHDVNMDYGWPTGDRVLQEVSSLLKSSIRAVDWVARYGGEEFCIIMTETALADGITVLERLRESIREHIFTTTTNKPIQVTVSMGADQVIASDAEFMDPVERASEWLRKAKNTGRNRLCYAEVTPVPEDAPA